MLVVAASLMVILVLAAGAGALIHLGPALSASSLGSTSKAFPSSRVSEASASGQDSECNYTVSLSGSTLVARASSGAETADSRGDDAGAFINSLLASHESICFDAGHYVVSTQIQVSHLHGVTFSLDPAAVMQATSSNRLLLVTASPETLVRGGEWIGSHMVNVSAITLQLGSNDSAVERTDVSGGGTNGILVYDNVKPCFDASVLDNTVHDNGRFGIQVFSNTTTGMTGTLVSGNVALDNAVGGIYTNSVAGVTIVNNVVRNTVGDGPGEIGIGVTNGHNDTVTLNQVEHMAWFGIQAFYNNYTVISHNISTFNAGGEDQSGITNDHSSYDTVVGNVVDSNGDYGVYVERSWNVTVSGNIADYNLGYGIGLYHGSLPAMGHGAITGNTCSFNGLGGIVLNSAIDDVISTNQCYNNSGDGILLYNGPGQIGSTGNLVSDNWLGNEGTSPPTQAFGISEGNDSYNNTLVSNVFVNNTVAAVSLLGGDAEVS